MVVESDTPAKIKLTKEDIEIAKKRAIESEVRKGRLILIPKKLAQRFRMSFLTWLFCLVLQFCVPIIESKIGFFSTAPSRLWLLVFLGLASFTAYVVLLVYIGKVSKRLKKSLVIWIGISIIIPLFSVVAYIHLSRRAKPYVREL